MPHIIIDPEDVISEVAKKSIPLQMRSPQSATRMEVYSLETALAECSSISLDFLENQGPGFQFTGKCTVEAAAEPIFYSPAFMVPTDLIKGYRGTLCFIIESDDAPTGTPPLYRRSGFLAVEIPDDMSPALSKIRFNTSTAFWDNAEFKPASGLNADQVKRYMLSSGCLRLTDKIGLVSLEGNKPINIIGRETVRDLADAQYLAVQTEFAERMVLFDYIGVVTDDSAEKEKTDGKRYYAMKTPPVRQYSRPPVLMRDNHYDLSPQVGVRWH